jgi:hypothetical protein
VVKNVGPDETWTIEAEASGSSDNPQDLAQAASRAAEAVTNELLKRDAMLKRRGCPAGGT